MSNRRREFPSIPLVSRAFITLACSVAILAGCANPAAPGKAGQFSPGERVSYRITNNSHWQPIDHPQLVAEPSGQVLYANLQLASTRLLRPVIQSALPDRFHSAIDPGDENLQFPVQTDSLFAAAPDQHRIPEYAWLRWRVGDTVHTKRVAVRSDIPDDVLALIQHPWRYRIDIVIGTNRTSQPIAWRLIDQSQGSPREIRRSEHWPRN